MQNDKMFFSAAKAVRESSFVCRKEKNLDILQVSFSVIWKLLCSDEGIVRIHWKKCWFSSVVENVLKKYNIPNIPNCTLVRSSTIIEIRQTWNSSMWCNAKEIFDFETMLIIRTPKLSKIKEDEKLEFI